MRPAIAIATGFVLLASGSPRASATSCHAEIREVQRDHVIVAGSIDTARARYAIVEPEPDSFLQIFELRQDPIAVEGAVEGAVDGEDIPLPVYSRFADEATFDVIAGRTYRVVFVDERGVALCSENITLAPRRGGSSGGTRQRLVDEVKPVAAVDTAARPPVPVVPPPGGPVVAQ